MQKYYLHEERMTIEEAIKEFGNSNRLCIALKIHRQSVRQWRKQGFITYKHQLKIQELTDNKLLAGLEKDEII